MMKRSTIKRAYYHNAFWNVLTWFWEDEGYQIHLQRLQTIVCTIVFIFCSYKVLWFWWCYSRSCVDLLVLQNLFWGLYLEIMWSSWRDVEHWKGVKCLMSRPFFSNDITHEDLDIPRSTMNVIHLECSLMLQMSKYVILRSGMCLIRWMTFIVWSFYNRLVTISYTLSGGLLIIETPR